jgi:hypothetical protein
MQRDPIGGIGRPQRSAVNQPPVDAAQPLVERGIEDHLVQARAEFVAHG